MARQTLLGEFLRARRAVTTPAQVGLLDVGVRRTPGLRRDEVATLASVSTDYYTRLEQGRERRPSDQVLGALAGVFALGPDATAHLYALARADARTDTQAGTGTGTADSQADQWPHIPAGTLTADAMTQVSLPLLRLMRGWSDTPALVINRCRDLLAINPRAQAFYRQGLHTDLKVGDNLLRALFLNPAAREFYCDWAPTARKKVAHVRAGVGSDLNDPHVSELVDELCDQSGEFRRLWARYDVEAESSPRIRSFRHDLVGELALNCDMFAVVGAPGQQLITFQAAPGSPSADALAELCRGSGEPDPALHS
ncbi:helix-turn-helix transcriptional regulator [Planotetraspora kaengkrachanensis]|uniref:Transcriptional regulator n=1 Tax=Planotetraspora kaengkrachanensis TaxID=575193 RepID=A0A8J3M0P6_9ACTN|nr:helix-turn-helix transcriptional regulator [Planotetraspora kaengkrachanensis]GIG79918.1 transcriptional regulator [Planotetraspora kaengkrachanensis]